MKTLWLCFLLFSCDFKVSKAEKDFIQGEVQVTEKILEDVTGTPH